jgi:hypothetical protein
MDGATMIRRIRNISIPLLLAALLAACASGMSKDECQVADWHAIGYEDGARGRPVSRVGEHRKSCAKHGMALDFEAYRYGWEDGLRHYCQPGNGYRQGRGGQGYAGVCPPELEAEFLDAYGQGRELHDMEARVRQTERTLRYKRKRLSQIETELRDHGLELVAAETATERRVILLDEMRKLENERGDVKAAIPALESKLSHQRQRLARLSAQSLY